MGILTAVIRGNARVPGGSIERISCTRNLLQRELKRPVQQTVRSPRNPHHEKTLSAPDPPDWDYCTELLDP